MAQAAGTRPCPYCGESIKATAVKCRFCGEFLDEEEEEVKPRRGPGRRREREREQADPGVLKWIVPVGSNIWAMFSGYLGILALIPLPLLIFGFFPEGNRQLQSQILWLAAGMNGLFGFLAIATGIGGLIMILTSERKQGGMIRAIFGILAGLVGGTLYPLLLVMWPELTA